MERHHEQRTVGGRHGHDGHDVRDRHRHVPADAEAGAERDGHERGRHPGRADEAEEGHRQRERDGAAVPEGPEPAADGAGQVRRAGGPDHRGRKRAVLGDRPGADEHVERLRQGGGGAGTVREELEGTDPAVQQVQEPGGIQRGAGGGQRKHGRGRGAPGGAERQGQRTAGELPDAEERRAGGAGTGADGGCGGPGRSAGAPDGIPADGRGAADAGAPGHGSERAVRRPGKDRPGGSGQRICERIRDGDRKPGVAG